MVSKTRYMKLMTTVLLLSCIFMTAQAQSSSFLEFTAGWQNYQIRDRYQSPLRYKGAGFLGGLGFSQLKEDYRGSYTIDFFSGNLKNKPNNKLDVSNLQYNSPKVYHVTEQSGVQYFVGIGIKVNFSFRSGTYIGGFDTAASLALVGSATYKAEVDDLWSHHAALSLPFFAWVTRPRYTSPAYVKKGGALSKFSNHFIGFPKFFGVDLQMGSTYFLDNGNAFRFDYQGQYYQILPLHPVRVLTNGFKTSALMKLK